MGIGGAAFCSAPTDQTQMCQRRFGFAFCSAATSAKFQRASVSQQNLRIRLISPLCWGPTGRHPLCKGGRDESGRAHASSVGMRAIRVGGEGEDNALAYLLPSVVLPRLR